jgi:hypothetical protein
MRQPEMGGVVEDGSQRGLLGEPAGPLVIRSDHDVSTPEHPSLTSSSDDVQHVTQQRSPAIRGE